MTATSCPQCGQPTDALYSTSDPNIAVCANCVSQNSEDPEKRKKSLLIAKGRQDEERRNFMWKSRVALVKKARYFMREKCYSDAAVAYEKYIRIIETVFDRASGNLTPELFRDSARMTELTVVASTYWDLLRIYDTSDNYGDRMKLSAKKLAEFLRFTPIYPDIIRKAQNFQRKANNPDVVKQFLKMSNEQRPRCFIATAAFLYPEADEIRFLVQFRDQILTHSPLGRLFISFYYFYSPTIAYVLDTVPALKPLARRIIRKIIKFLKLYSCKDHGTNPTLSL